MKSDINSRNNNGYTALMLAAEEGHAAIVQILIGAGADTSLRNKKREQAKDIASAFGHANVVQLLGR